MILHGARSTAWRSSPAFQEIHIDLPLINWPAGIRAAYFVSGGRSLETDDRSALQCAESKYPVCLGITLNGYAYTFAGRRWADLTWNYRCVTTANVDVFRDGVRITTTANDSAYTDSFYSSATSANYWICEAGKTT